MTLNHYRQGIERTTKQIADYDDKIAKLDVEISRLRDSIGMMRRSITKHTSTSTLRSKERQINQKEKSAADKTKKRADLQKKRSVKLSELHRYTTKAENAETREFKKRESEAKKKRDTELRHQREVTREMQEQSYLHRQMSISPLVFDITTLPTEIKVILFAANPRDQHHLRLDEEVREINHMIRLSEYRDAVNLIPWLVHDQFSFRRNVECIQKRGYSAHGTQANVCGEPDG